MLFNSWAFTFAFLPIVLGGYYLSKVYASPTIGFASLAFYAWWSVGYLFVLLASTIANFYVAQIITNQPIGHRRMVSTALAITANLAVLCYFKYVAFFAGVIEAHLVFHLSCTALCCRLASRSSPSRRLFILPISTPA